MFGDQKLIIKKKIDAHQGIEIKSPSSGSVILWVTWRLLPPSGLLNPFNSTTVVP